MYNRLVDGGYPADKTKRAALCKTLDIARWPSEIVSSSEQIRHISRPGPTLSNEVYQGSLEFFGSSNSCDFDRKTMEDSRTIFTRPARPTNPDDALFHPLENGSQTPTYHFTDLGLSQEEEWNDTMNSLPAMAQDNDITNFSVDVPSGMDYPIGLFNTSVLHFQTVPSTFGDDADELGDTSLASLPLVNTESNELVIRDTLGNNVSQSLHGTKLWGNLQNTPTSIDIPDLIDTPSPFPMTAFPSTPQYPGAVVMGNSKARPLDRWNSKSRASKLFNSDRNSSSTFDSGYASASGRNSPFSFKTVERQPRRIAPITSFYGLHRVPCKYPHEPRKYNPSSSPQPTDRYRDIATCTHCKYSAIHNLSWSAQYLKFEVVASELKLPDTYDVTSLDAAGNSALHYAAIGGANLEVITTLIDAGVSPCRINTSGELFLHCMRPQLDQNSLNFEEFIFPTFRTSLVNLLNDLTRRFNGFFRWRDNTGRTALESFVFNINDIDIRSRVRETIASAGYPLETLDGIKDVSQQPLSSQWYTFFDATNESPFDFNKVRQRIAKEITRHASTDPTFVHPETGDNILHALARLRFQESTDLISRIREFASKDVDLNLRNFDDDGPLSAFTQEPLAEGLTSEETGATISKYLDALLWKDAQKRLPNKINVNMRNREGATPLYYAAIRARPDSIRSLIEAGANVNARLGKLFPQIPVF